MQKIVKNIDRILLSAIPLISVPLLILFNCREYWLAALFFMLCVAATAVLKELSLKFFHNLIPAIIGGSISKIVFISITFLLVAKSGETNQIKMIVAHLIAFLVAKIYEIRILKIQKIELVSANTEIK
jgi:hypothetical protein